MKLRNFDPMDAGEAEIFAFDFSPLLTDPETIASMEWECLLIRGTDATPSARLLGDLGATAGVAKQMVGNLQAGATYVIRASATTSLTQVLILYSTVVCPAAIQTMG